jgi:hypothetical protein
MKLKFSKYLLYLVGLIFLPLLIISLGIFFNWFGIYDGPGKVLQEQRVFSVLPDELLSKSSINTKQILFGDLHVHTTFSLDAFQGNLPIIQGEGVHPVADACNFARFCSNLDFFAVTDHAEWLTKREWEDTINSIRNCSINSDNLDNPPIIPMLGWEWTQKSLDKSSHYGHKNVVLKTIELDKIPVRPIGAEGKFFENILNTPVSTIISSTIYDFKNRQNYFNWRYRQLVASSLIRCSKDEPVRELPSDCLERAETPEILFNKLEDWGVDAMVIPHGTAWGNTAPVSASWTTQLDQKNHNPKYQKLIELFSGHGNSEEYRSWNSLSKNNEEKLSCPKPSQSFIPECHQAGEIIKERCRVSAGSTEECNRRAEEARENYVRNNPFGFLTVPGSSPEEWLNAGQCLDCFLPAFNYRPKMSAQFALAIRDFSSGKPEGYRFGFIGSSDNHQARPGTGYKEFYRSLNSDSKYSSKNTVLSELMNRINEPQLPKTKALDLKNFSDRISLPGQGKRISSFLYTGGLVAAHSDGRNRDALWKSLNSREVYATSGERILLWFDLMNHSPNKIHPMGSEVVMDKNPVFRVKALGAQIQKPGCDLKSNKDIELVVTNLCKGECFNPSDVRKNIALIEIVRIRPQSYEGEPLDALIEDPWREFLCDPSQEGCTVEFKDEQFLDGNREFVYYARAIQETSAAINGGGLSCDFDESGKCLKVKLCGDLKGQEDGDCLAEVAERAWSSPIFINTTDSL